MRPLALVLVVLCACSATQTSGDICQQALDVIEACTGKAPEYPAEGCVDDFAETARAIVDGGCDAIDPDGKSDENCSALSNVFGLCEQQTLEQASRIATLAQVCPDGRDDALCGALRANDFAGARTAAREAARNVNLDVSEVDPALRYWIAQRVVSLVLFNRLTDHGARPVPADYKQAATDAIGAQYPAYRNDLSQLVMALTPLPPLDGTGCTSDHTIVYFPGVIRGRTKEELQPQVDAIQRALPCLDFVRVDTGNFIHPDINARIGIDTVSQLAAADPDARFHTIGYSQGSSNSLHMLVDSPEIAGKVVSSLVMNSAAHGSEVADIMHVAVRNVGKTCATMPAFAQATCQSLGNSLGGLLEKLLVAMDVPLDLRNNLAGHLDGIGSLTTTETGAFWADRGAGLPRHVLYTSFRSVVSNPKDNLPVSNLLFFRLLERVGGSNPFNDMQVRLANQSLGGPIADREVMLPVAEGNHWQWVLNAVDVDPKVMPAHMSERAPQTAFLAAYFQTLFELGVIQ